MRAVNTLGTGGFSEMFTATTKDSVPGRPDGPPKVVGVQSAGKNDLSLLVEEAVHDGGKPVTKYELRWTTEPQSTNDEGSVDLAPNNLQHNMVRRLDLKYTFEARAVNENGAGLWSEKLEVLGDVTDLPLSPQDLIAQNVVDRSFMLYWTMPDPADASVLAYELELTPECTIEIDGDACTTSATDDPGDPTTITIVTSDGMAWPTCRPVEYPCDAKCGDDENPWPAVNIGADPTSGACADDACKGCRKNADDRGAGVAAPARTGGECPVLSLDLRGCYKEVTGVRPNTQYEVKVVARNSVGGSIASVPVVVKTEPSVPDLAGDVTVVVFGTTSLDVSWKEPENNGAFLNDYKVHACVWDWETETTAKTLSGEDDCIPPVPAQYSAGCPAAYWNAATSPPCGAADHVPTTVTPLVPGLNYTVSVEAFNDKGSSGLAAVAVATTRAPPLKPYPPFEVEPPLDGLARNTSIHVMWHAPYDNGDPITRFGLEVDGAVVNLTASAAVPQYIASALEPGVAYSFRVRAENSYGVGAWSEPFDTSTEASVPGRPTGPPEVIEDTESAVTLELQPAEYTGGSPITDYEVDCDAGSPVEGCEGVVVLKADDATQFVLINRRGDLTYKLRSRALNSLGAGEWSELTTVVSSQVDLPPQPDKPSLVADSVTSTSFEMSWAMPAIAVGLKYPVSGYKVELMSIGGAVVYDIPLADACVGGCTATVGGLTQTTLYNTITIRAVNEIGASVKSQAMDVSVQTLAAPPDTAQILDTIRVDVVDVLVGAQDVTSTFIVSWVAHAATANPVQAYDVYACDVSIVEPSDFCAHHVLQSSFCTRDGDAGAICYTELDARARLRRRARRRLSEANASTAAENIGSSEVDYRAVATVDTLSPGRNYTVLVSARNAIGQSANVTANTGYGPRKEEYTTPAPPQRGRTPYVSPVYVGLSASKSLHVLWEPPFDQRVDIEAYQVIVDDGATPVELPQTISPQYILTGLIPGTLHTFSVAARNREGAGEYSDTFAARTADDVPGKPLAPIPQYLVKGERHYIEVEMQPAPYSGVELGVLEGGVLLYQLAEFVDGADQPSSLNYYNVSVDTMIETLPRNNARDYEFRERALGVLGWSEWSDPVYVPNDFTRVPSQPQNVTVDEATITDNAFEITWTIDALDKNANSSYLVRLKPTAQQNTSEGADPTAPDTLRVQVSGENCVPVGTKFLCSSTVEGARPDTRYAVEVSAENLAGPGLFSEVTEKSLAETDKGPPMGPAEMVVASITTTALNLSWVVPIDNGEKILGYVLHGISDDGDPIDVALTPDAQVFTPASRKRRSLAATAAADASCDALQAANPDPEQLAPFTPLSYIVGGLAKGTSYVLNVSACNALGASHIPACVCAPPLCESAVEGCVSTPLPAHTYDVPSAPDAPRELITDDFAVEARKAYEMFIELTPPFDHGLPLLGCELEFSNATYALAPDATGFNVSGLAPATQYGVRARSSNSLGWGDWSDLRFLSTKPVPPKTPAPLCDEERTAHDILRVNLLEAEGYGQPITRYEVRIEAGSKVDEPAEGVTVLYQVVTKGPTIEARLVDVTAANFTDFTGLNGTLFAGRNLTVLARAESALGWGDWSPAGAFESGANCATDPTPPPPPPPPIPWEYWGAPLIVLLALSLCAVCCCYYRDSVKSVIAPRLRRKKPEDEPLRDFVSHDPMPMEDHDPDLVMNPIFLARMAAEKERERAGRGKKGKGGLTGGGRTGGLARLGIKIDDREDKEANKPNTQKVDEFLIKQAKREANEKGLKAPETKEEQMMRALTMAHGRGRTTTRKTPPGGPKGGAKLPSLQEGTSTTEKF